MTPPLSRPDPCVQAWTQREEILYPILFGVERRGVFPIPAAMFTEVFKQAAYDPNWVRCGVFEFLPTARRASHLYVTSGLSNAWGVAQADPEGVSGLGCEFVLETLDRANWAVTRLHYLMSYHLLVCHGRYGDRQPLKDYDQIPLAADIGPEPSALTVLMLAPPAGFERVQPLSTGKFAFSQVVGISEAEAAAGRVHGGELLLKGLRQEGAFPVTIPERRSIL